MVDKNFKTPQKMKTSFWTKKKKKKGKHPYRYQEKYVAMTYYSLLLRRLRSAVEVLLLIPSSKNTKEHFTWNAGQSSRVQNATHCYGCIVCQLSTATASSEPLKGNHGCGDEKRSAVTTGQSPRA